MKPSLVYQTTATLSLSLALLSAGSAVSAITFDQKELDQSRVIAIAVPLAQGDRYNLLILEQLADTKQCWQDKADRAGVIDPLLLQFDFTNICGRSTDSNGYSIRIAGEDKSLAYRFSITKKEGHLVLLGVAAHAPNSPTLEIARTEGLEPGFLKFMLNPEWRFTKRIYQGKVLGHIYLTRDTILTTAGSTTAARSTATARPTLNASSGAPVFRGDTGSSRRPLSQASAYSSKAFPITAPIEIPVPRPFPTSQARYSNALPVSLGTGTLPALSGGVLPVPSASIPMGRAGNEPDLITASTPSVNLSLMAPGSSVPTSLGFQMAMVNPRYRVFVNATGQDVQRTVKGLVPDAFRAFYQGRSMMQVGAFQDRGKADEMIELLNRNGITSILAADQ